MNEQQSYSQELYPTLLFNTEQLAVRQSCIATKNKLFIEIAGNKRAIWYQYKLHSLWQLDLFSTPSSFRAQVFSEANDDDLKYFSDRWKNIQASLSIKASGSELHADYKICTEELHGVAHEDYEYDWRELENIFEKRNPYMIANYKAITSIGEKLCALRNENVYQVSVNETYSHIREDRAI